MKKKLSILAFGLLLAVGWTNSASAQKLGGSTPWYSSHSFMKMKQPTMTNDKTAQPVELSEKQEAVQSPDGTPSRAPQRANYTQTAPATHVKAWYDAKGYYWYDENDNQQIASYTDVVTDPHQMFWFTRTLYMDPSMPGIRYSEALDYDLGYNGCDFGYWVSGDIQQDIRIQITSRCYITAIYVYDYAGNMITSYDVDDGATPPTGWSMPNSNSMTRSYETVNNARWYYWRWTNNNSTTFNDAFVISKNLLAGYGGVYVDVIARSTTSGRTYTYKVLWHDYNRATYSSNSEQHELSTQWSLTESMINGPVTPPTENGYSVVLVKLTNDFDYETGQAEMYTYTDSALYAYFDKYVDELVLLTDGMRVKEGSVDAGTVFTYSGLLNRFYFIGKGKTYQISGSEDAWYTNSSNQYVRYADRAPFYNMYEEFSPATQDNQTGIDDFYSRMLEGESYGVIHDCQSVNYMEHFFSMTGKGGTENKSLTNLIFYIPDNRGLASSRDYEEEHAPQVGLYNITLTAEAQPVADYSAPDNRYYDVTCNWQSSLSQILDFDLDQDYELWIFVYDDQGNPVADSLLTTTHNVTTYTYQVPQYPDSYTIIYRVKGWPSDATNNPVNDPDGTFYAWSNLDDVLIPGFENFLSLKLDHYESDFKIDEEHNYYRNFMTVDNQNPDNALTVNRVLAGEDLFKLYRFADGDKNSKVKAAELSFFQQGNDIWYNIDYFAQNYVSGYDLPTLNIPTRGIVATIGGSTPTPIDITFNPGAGSTTNAGTSDQMSSGSVTVSSNGAAFGRTDHHRLGANSNTTFSTSSGTITKIVFNGTNAGYITPLALPSGQPGSLSVSGSVATWTGDASSVTFTPTSQVRCTSIVVTVTGSRGERAYTLLNDDLNVANYTQGYVYPPAPWSMSGTQLSLQTNGYFYILNGSGLNFTMPMGYNGASLKFVMHVGNSDYYQGSFVFTTSTGTYSVATTNQNTDYECIIPNVNSGDVINIKGTCFYNNTTYQYSPDFSTMFVYVEGGQGGVGGDDPLYLADIMIVDQFNASTHNDTHPYRYGYFLEYDPEEGDTLTSSVQEVPVQHTGATLDGFYTTDEIQGDTDMGLLMDVMNANVNMNLADNPAIYFYTLDRKPSNVNNAIWDEISQLQIRTNGTYQEIDEKLTQYIGETYDPGIVPRYDDYNIQYGNYNDYMSYVPIAWTHGELISNRRIKWETERLHNSYGAPIWKTGVGKVEIYQGTYAERQVGKFGSTNWADENNDSCSLYILALDAKGFLPTANTIGNNQGYVEYVPYWFNVYAKSETGQLRGFSWVGEGSPGAGQPGEPGSHVVNDPTHNRYLWHLYGGPTSDGILQHAKSNTWAENWIFGALDEIDDLEIVVRFYYVVNGMTGRDGGPAGYGSESPGFEPPTPTAVIENWTNRTVVSTIYVNPQGMQSDKPFDGVNIVITRYEDGTTSTSKVIR